MSDLTIVQAVIHTTSDTDHEAVIDTADGERYALTWSPQIGGDRWTVWGGPQYTKLVRSGSQNEALFVLKYPAHARVACARD
ncbi:hypothetical protein ABZ023_34215 [Streptomyces sp. NPDC006367]|uniref:hypothetical protein n=1 Tax=unclassified Streptomyces TaxID=2593676 RepID=UPI0033B6C7B0